MRYVWVHGTLILTVVLAATCAFAQIQNQPDDGQWQMPAKNSASTRYSTLDQINTGNVRSLKLAWTFSTGLTPGLTGEIASPRAWMQANRVGF